MAPQPIPSEFLLTEMRLEADIICSTGKDCLKYPAPASTNEGWISLLSILMVTLSLFCNQLFPFASKAKTASTVEMGESQRCVCFCFSNQIFISSKSEVSTPISEKASIMAVWTATGRSFQKYPALFFAQYMPISSDFSAFSFNDFKILRAKAVFPSR